MDNAEKIEDVAGPDAAWAEVPDIRDEAPETDAPSEETILVPLLMVHGVGNDAGQLVALRFEWSDAVGTPSRAAYLIDEIRTRLNNTVEALALAASAQAGPETSDA